MLAPLPVHRRARNWYGNRTSPAEPRHEAPPRDPRASLPVTYLAGIKIPIGSAPVDRRLTALL